MPNDGSDNTDLLISLNSLLRESKYSTLEEYVGNNPKLRRFCGLSDEKFSHQLITIALPDRDWETSK